MILEYINQDNSRTQIDLDQNTPISQEWEMLIVPNKADFITRFLPAFDAGQKFVLFDPKHTQLMEFYQNNPLQELEGFSNIDTNTQLLFFTSGSTGFPVGAFKSKENLNKELEALIDLLKDQPISRVVVTVPFVHIYGVLAGLLLPASLENITLVIKEDFLPYELLEEALKPQTLVITTPLFIKALTHIQDTRKINGNLFISSTGPLQQEDVEHFEQKYKSSVLQIFGSTETGGIATKMGNTLAWSPLKDVTVTANKEEKLSVSSPYISKYCINKTIQKLPVPFITEDIIHQQNDTFTLLGRSNKILKIAGKRIATQVIENLLEEIEGVQKAVVTLVYKKELLRSEQIRITLQAKQKIDKKLIKAKIAQKYGVLTIPFHIEYLDTIPISSMGKKILFTS